MIIFILNIFKKIFMLDPKFKTGDVIVSKRIDFPKKHNFKVIMGVGKYQYLYRFPDSCDFMTRDIDLVDEDYEIADPDIVKKTFGHR